MHIARSNPELHRHLKALRGDGLRLALVPTMGALHEAHLQLVDEARRHADRVVVSIFVNPMQFGAGEDFESYPRDLERDAQMLAARGADLVFAPGVHDVYPHGDADTTRVQVPGLSEVLCGAFRPGHFTGVATVVLKLLNLVGPDVALFGEKDYQQLAVIRRMVRDLDVPVEIVGVPTVREADGLAMSSRNAYLSAAERATAPRLFGELQRVAAAARDGAALGELETQAVAALREAGFRPDYVRVLRARDLAPAEPGDRDLVVLAAAWLGAARLIDNLPFERSSTSATP